MEFVAMSAKLIASILNLQKKKNFQKVLDTGYISKSSLSLCFLRVKR